MTPNVLIPLITTVITNYSWLSYEKDKTILWSLKCTASNKLKSESHNCLPRRYLLEIEIPLSHLPQTKDKMSN